jgi:hypothetical protein
MIKKTKKDFLSSGNLFLDKIVGGLSLGTIVLLVEDTPSTMYESFIKYFIADGIINQQKCFFYNASNSTIHKNLPYKSTQVESILNAKRVNDTKEMKIAWRYENIQYSNLLDEILKSTDYIFDLSRELQDIYLNDKNKGMLIDKQIQSEGNNILEEINMNIIKDYQDYASGLSEDEVKHCRIVIPNLFQNDTIDDMSKLKVNLNVLKNLARSINGIVYITLNKEFMKTKVYNTIEYFSDYAFELKSFIIDPQRLEDYDGLFYVRKLPRICTLKLRDLETDTYGLIVEKRKVVIEKIDIGVEVDRNTKVKEKDIPASQAICGQEKYSKNYEF